MPCALMITMYTPPDTLPQLMCKYLEQLTCVFPRKNSLVQISQLANDDKVGFTLWAVIDIQIPFHESSTSCGLRST